MRSKLKEFGLLTIATLIIAIGVYFFKFPNNFSFGGVTGIAIVLSKYLPVSAGDIVLILNILLMIISFCLLGKDYSIKTAYVSILMSVIISILERTFVMSAPLTDEPILELGFAIALPALGAALLFYIDASGGGTDIIAMILRKYTKINIGQALFFTDLIVVVSSGVAFGIKTGLYSFTGLMIKSFVVEYALDNMKLCKFYNVVCSDPKPICDFIINQLHRSATTCCAKGAYTQEDRYIIFTAVERRQSLKLKQYINVSDPKAFVMVCDTSEVIGKGFNMHNIGI